MKYRLLLYMPPKKVTLDKLDGDKVKELFEQAREIVEKKDCEERCRAILKEWSEKHKEVKKLVDNI